MPLLFGGPRARPLRRELEGLVVDGELAAILFNRLGVDFEEALRLAQDAIRDFASRVSSRGRRRFYYLDTERHILYTNDVGNCAVEAVDLWVAITTAYTLDAEGCRRGMAAVVLEEELGGIAGRLAQRLGWGREEVEAKLRRALEELKSDPYGAVEAGFARLLLLPPSSEDELRQELLKYARGKFQSRELKDVWSEAVLAEQRPVLFSHIVGAYLAGKTAGYRLPEDRFRVYESGGKVMVAGWNGSRYEVAWFKVGRTSWEEIGAIEVDLWTLKALEGVVAEDFRRGHSIDAMIRGIGLARELFEFAHAGYVKVAREAYRMGRDGRVYARAVDDSRGEDLAVHIIWDPDERDKRLAFLFVVEHAGNRYLMDLGMVTKVLLVHRKGRLGLLPEEYRALREDYERFHEQGYIAKVASKVFGNPRVRLELPSELVEWLQERASPEGHGREKRSSVSAGA